MGYFLTFSMHFDRDQGLDQGRLCLRHIEQGTLQVWTATSSTSSNQGKESFHNRGGLIPPEYRVPGLKNWTVETKPIPMPNNLGVAGNFYKINPHSVTTDKGGVRGDFGIHLDGNAPGSLGCIVLTKDRLASFESEIQKLANLGIKQLPLFITYS